MLYQYYSFLRPYGYQHLFSLTNKDTPLVGLKQTASSANAVLPTLVFLTLSTLLRWCHSFSARLPSLSLTLLVRHVLLLVDTINRSVSWGRYWGVAARNAFRDCVQQLWRWIHAHHILTLLQRRKHLTQCLLSVSWQIRKEAKAGFECF